MSSKGPRRSVQSIAVMLRGLYIGPVLVRIAIVARSGYFHAEYRTIGQASDDRFAIVDIGTIMSLRRSADDHYVCRPLH